jgi:hypothetical protein
LEGCNLLFNFTAFTFRTLEFFLLIFRNFHDHGKRLFTFFTNKFVCGHSIISFYLVPERKLSFSPISASDSNFNPRNTQCMSVVKIFVLTRGFHAPRPSGQLESCPNLLSCRFALILTKNPGFRSGTTYEIFYPSNITAGNDRSFL